MGLINAVYKLLQSAVRSVWRWHCRCGWSGSIDAERELRGAGPTRWRRHCTSHMAPACFSHYFHFFQDVEQHCTGGTVHTGRTDAHESAPLQLEPRPTVPYCRPYLHHCGNIAAVIFSYCAAALIGRMTDIACPSVCPFVLTHCLLTRKPKKHRKTNIGLNVSQNMSNWYANSQIRDKWPKSIGHQTSKTFQKWRISCLGVYWSIKARS